MANKTPPGSKGLHHVDIRDGTSALTAMPVPGPTGASDVSIEIGASFLPVGTGLSGISPAEMQVLAWLRANRSEIAAAERTFRVDRRAIAGAIAWEMLENVKTQQWAWVGPGKVHTADYSRHSPISSLAKLAYNGWIAGDLGKGSLAEEVESFGYLPKQTFHSRVRLLGTTSGAITYIAASMAAFAEIAYRHTGDDLRSRPEILTNAYQSKTLTTWEDAVARKVPGAPFSGGNPMDIWVTAHLAYLEDGVGQPALPETTTYPASPIVPAAGAATKIVVMDAGASLSSVAMAEYGTHDLWPLLYDLNKDGIGANPNMVSKGFQLSVAPLTSYTSEQIKSAKQRAPSWKTF